MVEQKIMALLSLILIEMVSGLVVIAIPDPYVNTLTMLNSDPKYKVVDETGYSWLSLAQKTDDSYHLTKNMLALFLVGIAPMLTVVPIVRHSG